MNLKLQVRSSVSLFVNANTVGTEKRKLLVIGKLNNMRYFKSV